jgi:putative ABC transport system substrate-binding protein
LLALLAVLPGRAASRQTIAVLFSHEAPPYQQALEGFQSRLSEQGLEASYDRWSVEGDEQLAAALARIEKNPPKLILALGTRATRAAIAAHYATPIVATLIFDAGELKGAANATGVTLEFPIETQWHWFKRLLPQVRNLGVLYDPTQGRRYYRELEKQAANERVELTPAEAPAPEYLPDALKSLPSSLDALWGLGESRVLSPQTAREILLFSFRNRVPFIGLSSSWVKAGSLYALDRDYSDLGRQCADMAASIFKGAPVSSLPPTAPRKVIYSLNLKTAEHMKLEFSDEIVRNAHEVFH